MGKPLRLFVVTWDGAGNLPPILALVDALVRRGHRVDVLGHDVQKESIEAAGGVFQHFGVALQIDHSRPQPLGDDPIARLAELDEGTAIDTIAAIERLTPDAVLIDCMLPGTLRACKATGRPTVALVHALYGVFVVMAKGIFRGPIDDADLALGFSYLGFNGTDKVPPNFVFVGPARIPATRASWPRRRPELPFVLASLSSGLQGKPGTQHALLQRVCDALAAVDIEALVTTGRGIEPDAIVVGPSTIITRFAPHDLLLQKGSLFITHAGHGSIMAGLAAGVPMLCLPPGADQPFNAARVASLGLGETLDPTSPSDLIARAVTRLLADVDMRQRSRNFASSMADHPGIELAVERVEGLVA